MRAIGKYVVIEPIKEVDVQTKGGLILAEKQREDVRYRRANVLEPGSDVSVLKKGDEVYYDKAAGFNIEIKKEEYKVIKEHDVVIIL
jgi:co-chaperonin GroES (HSP10)